MITSLSLRNFKVLRNVDVQLRPLTVIVGPNGSGKSTLLEALDFGLTFLAQVPPVPTPILNGFKSRLPRGQVQITLQGEDREQPFALILAESDRALTKGMPVRCFPVILDLDARKLAEPSPARSLIQTLPADGSFLAWLLASLHLEAPGHFNDILERLRAVVPAVQGLRVRPVALGEGVGYELLFDMKGGEGIPARQVSEGTLVTLALLVLLAGPNPPGLVLIENLERSLHPKALQELVRQIRLVQEHNPNLQIVATSHSPYLLDSVEAGEILLTSLDEDGYASVKSLTEHPEYDRWKDVMAPGEFWSTVGESWIVQKA